jgi:O-antigen ligase
MGSFLIRIEVWSATLDEYQDDIVLGRGPAKLDRVTGFRDASSFHVRDNIYIAFLAQFGIVGLVGFLGFSLTQIIKLFSLTRRANPPDQWWPIGMLGTMAAWMLFGVAADTFFYVPASHILLVLYGTALVAGEPEVATRKSRGPGPTDAYDPTFKFPE